MLFTSCTPDVVYVRYGQECFVDEYCYYDYYGYVYCENDYYCY